MSLMKDRYISFSHRENVPQFSIFHFQFSIYKPQTCLRYKGRTTDNSAVPPFTQSLIFCDYFSHFWLATVHEVLQADWQEAWHSPQPPLAADSFRLALFRVLMCFVTFIKIILSRKVRRYLSDFRAKRHIYRRSGRRPLWYDNIITHISD